MPNYKRLFLSDYSYFLTINTQERNPILVDNIELLRESFKKAKSRYSFDIDAIVVLPDHIHTILTPKIATDYPNIIRVVKQYFSRHCDPRYYKHIFQSHSRTQKGYKPIWQKRYYEHTIRDEKDYNIHLNYIHYNPVKHGWVERASDWEHSSIHKFIEMGYYHQDWYDVSSDEYDFE